MNNSFRDYANTWESPSNLAVIQCFRDAWEMFLRNPGISAGYVLMAFLITLIGGFFALIIPIIGNFFYLTLFTVLYAGFFIAGYKLYRNEEVGVSDFLNGFNHIGKIAVLVIIQCVFFIALFIPIGVFAFFIADSTSSSFVQDSIDASLGIIPLIFSLGIIGIFFAFIIGYLFAVPNITHLELKAWDAMELSRRVIFKVFLRMLGLFFLLYVLNLAGMLALGVGLFVTIPVSVYAIQAAWEQMIGDKSVNHIDQLLDEFGSDHNQPFESQY